MSTNLHALECFTFTDRPIEELQSAGFVFSKKNETLLPGCHTYGLQLPANFNTIVQIIYQIIENESLLVEKKILPKAHPQAPSFKDLDLPINDDFKIIGLVYDPESTDSMSFTNVPKIQVSENTLIQHWQIRKKSPIWALVLQCKKLPQENILFQKEKAFHLQMHANLFDFIFIN